MDPRRISLGKGELPAQMFRNVFKVWFGMNPFLLLDEQLPHGKFP
jgi:hypothetical protein